MAFSVMDQLFAENAVPKFPGKAYLGKYLVDLPS